MVGGDYGGLYRGVGGFLVWVCGDSGFAFGWGGG